MEEQAGSRLEASRRDAEAQVVLAEASQTATRKVAETTLTGELPVVYLLGEKYIEAMRSLANSQNSMLIILPTAVRSLPSGLDQGARQRDCRAVETYHGMRAGRAIANKPLVACSRRS